MTWTYMSPDCLERRTGMPFADNRNRRPDWVPGGIFTPTIAPIDGWEVKFTTKCRRNHGNGYPTVQIGSIPLKKRVRGDAQENVKIA